MNWVLDLDLDFFVWPVKTDRPTAKRLPRRQWTSVASAEEVDFFLEKRCHLNRSTPIEGRLVTDHVEALDVWQEWMDQAILERPFGVVHVDAHADLGAGANHTFAYLDKLLALPMNERSCLRRGAKALNSGNYLLGAIANRWLQHLKYVYPVDPILKGTSQTPGDLPHQVFVNADWHTRQIQLKGYRRKDWMLRNPTPYVVEPSLPFDLIPATEFEFSGFTHMLVARSPQYTPLLADTLIRVISGYFASQ